MAIGVVLIVAALRVLAVRVLAVTSPDDRMAAITPYFVSAGVVLTLAAAGAIVGAINLSRSRLLQI